jgi:elongation factor Ts
MDLSLNRAWEVANYMTKTSYDKTNGDKFRKMILVEGASSSEPVLVDGKEGTVVELNSETDFVAKNTDFQGFLGEVVKVSLAQKGNMDAIKTADLNGKTVADTLTGLISTIGENMNLRRSAYVSVENGVVVPYIHTATVPGMGKIGVLVALESTADATALQEAGKKIAMHIAAANPRFLDVASVDADTIAHEKSIYEEQAKNSGKPEAIIAKMVEGRMRKFYEEVVLLEQAFIMDPDKKIKDVLAETAKAVGADIKLVAFERFGLGEGIEKKEEDFAAEVAKQING